MPVERNAWSAAEAALWERIEAHAFEPADHALTFVGRLARDHGWSPADARAAVDEYRRFAFLAMTAGAPMTPSEEVDEVWHLHLTFSRDYWDVWCRTVLGAPLHHDPTTGSPPDRRRFADQYARTLAAYEAFFGPPDAAFWPGVADRFGKQPRFRTVDRDHSIIIPRLRTIARGARRLGHTGGIAALISFLTSGPAGALPLNVLDWPGEPFLMVYGCLAIGSVAAALLLGPLFRRAGGGSSADGELLSIDLALLAGGAQRAADVAALTLIDSGHLDVDPRGLLATATNARAPVDPTGAELYRRATAEPLRRKALVDALVEAVGAARQRLARHDLVLTEKAVARLRLAQACLICPVVLLGLAKIAVGLSRGRPVGFLVATTVAAAVVCVIIVQQCPIATTAGRLRLARFEADHARLLRAPLPHEVIAAFAVAGTAALVGTHLAHVAPFFAPSGQSGSDGGGGCGGDGGGGGGGCGGCGGGD